MERVEADDRVVEYPAFIMPGSRADGLRPSATRASARNRPFVRGVYVHPGRTELGFGPRWADEDWFDLRNKAVALQHRSPELVLSDVSAARFHGWPLPSSVGGAQLLRGRSARQGQIHMIHARSQYRLPEGFLSRRPREVAVVEKYGARVVEPMECLRQIARWLSEDELLEVIDAVCGPWHGRALDDPAGIAASAVGWVRFRGKGKLLRAAARARAGTGSPQETRARLRIVDFGLPEPEVSPAVPLRGRTLHPDLAYRDIRIAIDYEGDHHRTDAWQWDHDISRAQLFQEAGWQYYRVNARTDMGSFLAMLTEVRRERLRWLRDGTL
ncbi:hypothetical protein [Brevibacterium album]|uniref:hypothetical protein n=1 Tax=Brevibacterium album TaxID=417948 RepID=UPI00048B174D|nr:hypothetical protein [Brevibacterium album]